MHWFCFDQVRERVETVVYNGKTSHLITEKVVPLHKYTVGNCRILSCWMSLKVSKKQLFVINDEYRILRSSEGFSLCKLTLFKVSPAWCKIQNGNTAKEERASYTLWIHFFLGTLESEMQTLISKKRVILQACTAIDMRECCWPIQLPWKSDRRGKTAIKPAGKSVWQADCLLSFYLPS